MSWELTQRRIIRTINSRYFYGRIPLVHAVIFFVQMAIVARLTSRFNAYYEERPLLTMMVTNTVLGGIADTVAQTITAVRAGGARKASVGGGGVHTGNSRHPSVGSNDNLSVGGGSVSAASSRSASPLGDLGGSSNRGGGRADELVVLEDQSKDRPDGPDRKGGGGLRDRAGRDGPARPPPFDFERLTRYMAYGFFMAPIQFKWFGFLSRAFPLTKTSALAPALKRVVFDQLVFAPLGIAWFFTVMTVTEGGGRRAVETKLRDMFVPTLKANFVIWPAVQMINFRLMPVPFQLPFVSTVGIAWTAYLSLTNAAEDVQQARMHIPDAPSIRLE